MATILLLVSVVLCSFVAVECSPPTCVAVMTKYRAKGLLQSDVPSQAVSGEFKHAGSIFFCLTKFFKGFLSFT